MPRGRLAIQHRYNENGLWQLPGFLLANLCTYCIRLTYPIFQDEATTIITKFSLNQSSRSVICNMLFRDAFGEMYCVLWYFGCQAIISSESFLFNYFSFSGNGLVRSQVYTLQLRQWQIDALASLIDVSFSSYSILRQIHDPVRVRMLKVEG